MPRSAATIFGLVLVVCSIGFNTWRYPIVWRMAGESAAAAASGDSSQASASTAAAQPAKPLSAEPQQATPPPTLATQGETKPATDAANKAMTAPLPPPDASPPVAEHRLPASTSQERPLVPVPRVVAAEKPAAAAESVPLRRLPPVDPNVSPPAVPALSETSGGAIPIYPTTGIR